LLSTGAPSSSTSGIGGICVFTLAAGHISVVGVKTKACMGM
jgi:hypothetical protein